MFNLKIQIKQNNDKINKYISQQKYKSSTETLRIVQLTCDQNKIIISSFVSFVILFFTKILTNKN